MRALCLLALLCLIGCGKNENAIDASSDESMKQSVERIKKPLSPEKQKEFDAAMMLIALTKGMSSLEAMEDIKGITRRAVDGKTADEVIAMGAAIKAEQKGASRSNRTLTSGKEVMREDEDE